MCFKFLSCFRLKMNYKLERKKVSYSPPFVYIRNTLIIALSKISATPFFRHKRILPLLCILSFILGAIKIVNLFKLTVPFYLEE